MAHALTREESLSLSLPMRRLVIRRNFSYLGMILRNIVKATHQGFGVR